jgi:hypothetical protein
VAERRGEFERFNPDDLPTGSSTKMSIVSLRFGFCQSLRAPARAAYAWCTDFGSADGALFPQRWERAVRRLSADALLLTDVTYPRGRRRTIHRLIRLNPSELAWTNTHLDGPFRHSQYWYRIVADGPRRSHLEFRGLRLLHLRGQISVAEASRRAENERREDSELWRVGISPALARDLA